MVPIDPNLIIQMIIIISNVLLKMHEHQQELEEKTKAELLQVLTKLNDQVMSQPDLTDKKWTGYGQDKK